MREWVAAIRAVFDCWQHGTPLAFDGQFTTHTMMPPLLAPQPLASGPPPILLGALGPRMLSMTLEAADGVVLHPMTTEAFLSGLTEQKIPEGLARAGRDRADFEVVGGALVGVHGDDDRQPVRDALRGMVAFYGSTPAYRPVLETIGAGDLQDELRELTRAGRRADLPAVIDDQILEQLVVVGTPTEVAKRLRHLYDSRVDRLSLTFVQPLPVPGLPLLIDALRAS